MKSTIITEVMVRDHIKIVKLLNEFEKRLTQDRKIKLKAFNEFVWELEKHFFTEEKAIFISYNPHKYSSLTICNSLHGSGNPHSFAVSL